MELADLIVVNKADGDNLPRAKVAEREFNNALHYIRNATKGWQTKAQICSARTGAGIDAIWRTITEFCEKTGDSGVFEQRRLSQTAAWFEDLISEAVLSRFFQSPQIKVKLPELREQVAKGKIPVAYAVSILFDD